MPAMAPDSAPRGVRPAHKTGVPLERVHVHLRLGVAPQVVRSPAVGDARVARVVEVQQDGYGGLPSG
jgi:hypothetical protein